MKLEPGMVLYEPEKTIEHVYFLNGALVSIISTNSEGSTIEIGLVGNEGVVGVPAILGGVAPYRAIVQIGGSALRVRRELAFAGVFGSYFIWMHNTSLVKTTTEATMTVSPRKTA